MINSITIEGTFFNKKTKTGDIVKLAKKDENSQEYILFSISFSKKKGDVYINNFFDCYASGFVAKNIDTDIISGDRVIVQGSIDLNEYQEKTSVTLIVNGITKTHKKEKDFPF